MSLAEHVALGLVVDVGVDRRGDDGTVAEECLDEAEIYSLLKEHCGHRMSENVRSDFFESGRTGMSIQRHPDRLLRKPTSAAVREEKSISVPATAQGGSICNEGRLHLTVTNRNQPFLVALAADKDGCSLEINRRDSEIRNLRNAHARGEHQLEKRYITKRGSAVTSMQHSPVAVRVKLPEERLQRRKANRSRQKPTQTNIEPEVSRRIGFNHSLPFQKSEQGFDRRQLAPLCSRFVMVKRAGVVPNQGAVDLSNRIRLALLRRKTPELPQVKAIRFYRMVAEIPLELAVIEEGVDAVA